MDYLYSRSRIPAVAAKNKYVRFLRSSGIVLLALSMQFANFDINKALSLILSIPLSSVLHVSVCVIL